MEEEFTGLLERLIALFGEDPFAFPSTGRKSRPLYDALMIALSDQPDLDMKSSAEAIRLALDSALHEGYKYDVLVGRGNTMAAIRERVVLAGEILRGEVD